MAEKNYRIVPDEEMLNNEEIMKEHIKNCGRDLEASEKQWIESMEGAEEFFFTR